ncbi:MAG: 2-C-methyl-D-erythritol 2,4-cyclodiphosphate synthase [Bacillota bacterium]
MRVGIGFDIHRLKEQEKLILGGVEIQYKMGLVGHSDADVLTHALIDAILGALGKGDIGQHFPDNEEIYRGINSLILLKEVYALMKKNNFKLNNADLILIAQKPKVSSYSEKIVRNFCDILCVDSNRINFKATTSENIGFIGREEGMAAKAIVSLIENEK